MINHKKETINSLSTALIVGVLLFLFTAFSDKSVNQTRNNTLSELQSEIHSDYIKAVVVDAVNLPALQKSHPPTLSNLFNTLNKIFVESKKINQSFIVLQKIQLSIKPVINNLFHHIRLSKDDDDSPVLS